MIPSNQQEYIFYTIQYETPKTVKTVKTTSFWSQNKLKIIAITIVAMAAVATIVFCEKTTKPECVGKFSDPWDNKYCLDGKVIQSNILQTPIHCKFIELVEQCANSSKMSGCLDGKFYRELTQECKDNPWAAFCTGKYDYQKDFIDKFLCLKDL